MALVVLAVVAIRAWQTRGTARGPAPALEGRDLSGAVASLAAHRGRTVLVYFWATWCGVCKLTQGSVASLAEGHDVITVASHSGSAADVRRALGGAERPYPIVADPDGRLAARYGVQGFPTFFVVDPEGQIRSVEVGYTSELGLWARLAWAGL